MKKYAMIALGGMLGAMARTGLERSFPWDAQAGIPVLTLLINVTGSFLLTLLLTLVVEHWDLDSDLRQGMSTGFLAAFTTFSTFTMEAANMIQAGRMSSALLYLISSAVIGLLAAAAGFFFANWLIRSQAQSTRNQEGGSR